MDLEGIIKKHYTGAAHDIIYTWNVSRKCEVLASSCFNSRRYTISMYIHVSDKQTVVPRDSSLSHVFRVNDRRKVFTWVHVYLCEMYMEHSAQ